MYWNDDPSGTTTMPTPGAAGTGRFFPSGTPSAVVTSDFLNILTAELVNLLTAASITPDKTNQNQITAAVKALITAAAPQRLTQTLNLYVNGATGNNSNNGLTSGTAFASIGTAVNYATARIQPAGQIVQINIAAGTYSETVTVTNYSGIVFNGVGNSTIVNGGAGAAFQAEFGAGCTVQNLTMTGDKGLYALAGAQILVQAVNFSTCAHWHMATNNGGTIMAIGSYSVSGSSPVHVGSSLGSAVLLAGVTVTLTGNPAFSAGFAVANQGGQISFVNGINVTPTVFVGSATGSRYGVSTCSVIETNSQGASYLPGSIAGTAESATFGVYS